jgi:hypothetical protein
LLFGCSAFLFLQCLPFTTIESATFQCRLTAPPPMIVDLLSNLLCIFYSSRSAFCALPCLLPIVSS